MSKIKITIIEGTNRKDRRSIHAANYIKDIGGRIENLDVNLIDPEDYDLATELSAGSKYKEIIKNSDAFFIVTPEYNQGYPGTLKTLLDNDLPNYKNKPVYIAGVSSGIFGGARAIQGLIPVLRRLGMILGPNDLYFPKVQEIFDKNGKLQDEDVTERVESAF